MVTNSFRRPVIFRAVLLSIAVAAMFISGCSGMNMYKITYNPDRQVYEYPLPGMGPVTLRTNSGELVTEDNFEQFIVELSDMSFMYPFDDRIELAGSPKGSDLKVASLYSESVHQIQEEQFKKAAETMDSLEEYYPEAVFYTDIAFLKGYANEKVGMKAEAKSNYENYLAFSSGKFSDRFRNYRYADEKDIHWLQQREYATRYLADLSPQTDAGFLQAIKPQYYFSSLQPGYTLNPEDQYERPRGIFSVSLGSDLSSDFSGGFQYYRNLIGGVDINPEFAISRNMWEIKMAIPVQVYRSDNNRLGIKVSPFGHYSRITTFKSGGFSYDVDESVFNYGVKTSMGFFIIQRLSLGAYYTWNFYNEDRPFRGNEQLPNMWWENEYDVSLYFPLIKGLNLKGGIKSGDWVAGFYLPGWEISYNINERNFILRTEMY